MEYNIDEELQKIVNDSVQKAKNSGYSNLVQFISPLNDLNKKEKSKSNTSPTKFKLIVKKENKIQIKEIDKNVFSKNSNQ